MILTALVFLLVLSILVFVHEFGHFITAKFFGMYVEEFGFGLPPRIWGKKIGETVYSINALPIGGFVKLHGEDLDTEDKEPDPYAARAFYNYRKLKRIIVLMAGVTMNFLLAVVVISFIFTKGVLMPSDKVRVETVLPNSPAAIAGLQVGDVINVVKGKKITKSEELINITKNYLGEPVRLGIIRTFPNGKVSLMVIIVTPRIEYPKGEGPMGVAVSNLEEKKYPWYQAPFYGLKEAVDMSITMVTGIAGLLWNLITFKSVPKDIAGPIGIAQITGQAVKFGWMAVLQLLGILSLNLAVVNILPIPALDGGRLMFIFLEKIIGRKIRANIEMRAHQIGMALLLTLMALITINDVIRVLKEKNII